MTACCQVIIGTPGYNRDHVGISVWSCKALASIPCVTASALQRCPPLPLGHFCCSLDVAPPAFARHSIVKGAWCMPGLRAACTFIPSMLTIPALVAGPCLASSSQMPASTIQAPQTRLMPADCPHLLGSGWPDVADVAEGLRFPDTLLAERAAGLAWAQRSLTRSLAQQQPVVCVGAGSLMPLLQSGGQPGSVPEAEAEGQALQGAGKAEQHPACCHLAGDGETASSGAGAGA